MNFLALLLGLAVERLLTQLFHLREFHWLDPLFDKFLSRLGSGSRLLNIVAVWVFLALALLPVTIVLVALQDRLAHIPLFLFSIFVLLFCLGPRDLGEEVIDYRQAIDEDNTEELRTLAAELFDRVPDDADVVPDVEKAIYAQANNRIFGVVFWFALFGPVGAWMFRVVDLLRRRALNRRPADAAEDDSSIMAAILLWHRVLAWIPSRLLMAGYAMAGNYDGALAAWRKPFPEPTGQTPSVDDQLLGAIGCGAADRGDERDISSRAQVAIDLVIRTLWMIWCPVLALLTLYGAIN
jgi:AmpE protein